MGVVSTVGMTNEEAYRKYADDLVRYATGLVGPFDAADVVSEAFLRAFHAPGWETATNPRGYLYRTVLNVARDHHRSTLARRLREMRTAQAERLPEVENMDIGVLEVLDRLTVRQRAAVVLTYWEDLTPEGAADRMGISPGAVKRHLARARKRLKEWLR